MSYKLTNIQPFLKHVGESNINEHFLKQGLWYLTSTESYIQRTTTFDGSVFDIKSLSYRKFYDVLFLLLLFDTLKLTELNYYYGNMIDLDNDVDALTVVNEKDNLLFLHHGNKSALFSFYDKLRNSLAHGTFNQTDDRFIMIGQNKAKINSIYNYYLQIRNERDLYYFFKKSLDSDWLSKDQLYSILNKFIIEINSNNIRVIIDDSFEKLEHITLLQQFEYKYLNDDFKNCIVLVPVSSNLSLKNMFFKENNTQIVTTTKLIEYLGLPIKIHNWKDKKDENISNRF